MLPFIMTPKNKLLFLAVVLTTLAVAGATLGKERAMPEQEEAILELHRQFITAWSGGDVERLITLFHDDAVRVGTRGDVQRGKADMRRAFSELFSGPYKGATVTMGKTEVRMLSPDLALWQGPMEIRMANDKAPVRGYALDVVEKRAGAWRILETHPKLFPPDRR